MGEAPHPGTLPSVDPSLDPSIALSIPLRAYRAGLAAALTRAQLSVSEVSRAQLPAWVGSAPWPIVVLGMDTEDGTGLLGELRLARPDALIVALAEGTMAATAAVLQAGASSLVAWEADPEEVVEVVMAATWGRSLLPVEVARALASGTYHRGVVDLTAGDRRIIRKLAWGTKVADLAHQTGYTPRHTARLLADLYRRMGAANRTEALMLAVRWGLLDDWRPSGGRIG